ncbi:MAG: glycerate kinase [Ruminococcaceae bacterium]|nr:glycerate kinase [Oscillospiraceae bacterium]
MKYLVAMDSFKGNLTSQEAGAIVREGILSVAQDAEVQVVPIADGGEGTVDAIVAGLGGEIVEVPVTDAIGRPIRARFGVAGKVAVIEMAAASGLPLIEPELRDAKAATTFGTGELVRAALDRGCREFIVGLGGSATTDGGSGMARALGVRFLDAAGEELPPGGGGLGKLTAIDLAGLDPRLKDCSFRIACDVDNPLCGAHGSAAIFGPQKGASPEDVAILDRNLAHYAAILADTIGADYANVPGAGAAGGLSMGFMAFCGGQLEQGIDLVLDAIGFDRLAEAADIVISGEGATDYQTAYGKAPVGVCKRGAKYGKPGFIISGTLGRDYDAVYDCGVTAALSTIVCPITTEESMARSHEMLRGAAVRLTRTIEAVRRMEK